MNRLLIRCAIAIAYAAILTSGNLFAVTLNLETSWGPIQATPLFFPECVFTPVSNGGLPSYLSKIGYFPGAGGAIVVIGGSAEGHWQGDMRIDFTNPVTGLSFETVDTKYGTSVGSIVTISAFAGSTLITSLVVTTDRVVDFSTYTGITRLVFHHTSTFGSGFAYGNFNFVPHDVGGFETGALSTWVPFGNVVSTVTTANARTGSFSLSETPGTGGVYWEIPTPVPGTTYHVTAYALSSSSNPGGGQAMLVVHDTTGANVVFDGWRTPSSTKWDVFSVNFIATASGRLRIHLYFNGGGGTVYWDDIQVSDSSGFENGFLDTWSPFGGVNATVGNSVVNTGSFSLSETGGGGGVYQDFRGLTPGALYQVTASARSASSTTGQSLLWVHDVNGANSVFDGWRTPSSTGWDTYSVIFKASPNGLLRIHLFFNGGTGTVFWDDIHVIDLSGAESNRFGAWLPFGKTTSYVTSSLAKTGTYSIVETEASGGLYLDLEGLTPGAMYQVKAVARGNVSTVQAALLVHDTLGNGTVIDGLRTPSTSTWDTFAVTFIATATGRMRIHLIYYNGTNQSGRNLFWDDIRVSDISGFEIGPLFSTWSPIGNLNPIISTAAANTGTYSVVETNGDGGIYMDLTGLTAGTTYQVTAAAHSDSLITGYALLWVHDSLGGGSVFDGWRIPSTGGWDTFSVNFTPTSNGKMRIHLLFSGGAGTVYWDDIRIH